MKVVILCGGKGTRLREETEYKPKPLIEIGDRPILWHIMKTYAQHGLTDFVLCLGYKGEMIKRYFLDYQLLNSDFTVELGTKQVSLLNDKVDSGWKVSLVDTGLTSMTGARIKRVEPYVDGQVFMATYGDGVTDLNIRDLLQFHEAHGKIGTVTGVIPHSRYGELIVEGDRVTSFQEKPPGANTFVNGGFFVFNREFFDYLEDDDSCVLERAPLERLTRDGELRIYRHEGFWQCMDTAQDYQYLRELWDTGQAPWSTWNE